MSHTKIKLLCACALTAMISIVAFASEVADPNKNTADYKENTLHIAAIEDESDSIAEDIINSTTSTENTQVKLNITRNINEVEKLTTQIKSNIEETTQIPHIVLNTEIIESEETAQETESETQQANYITKTVPSGNSFKSYMSYTAITRKSSPQYKLQQQAYTGEYGIRMVNDRYCIALGTFYSSNIGTPIDIVMANGNIFKCILADVKANQHTCVQNIRAQDGSVLEFVIDRNALERNAKRMGNVSYANEKFAGEIIEIRVYQ